MCNYIVASYKHSSAWLLSELDRTVLRNSCLEYVSIFFLIVGFMSLGVWEGGGSLIWLKYKSLLFKFENELWPVIGFIWDCFVHYPK